MHGVVSWCFSCVLAQGLPECLAMFPVAETPLATSTGTSTSTSTGPWVASSVKQGLLTAPELGGRRERQKCGREVSQCGKAAHISAG